jgi:hypothetical protein
MPKLSFEEVIEECGLAAKWRAEGREEMVCFGITPKLLLIYSKRQNAIRLPPTGCP